MQDKFIKALQEARTTEPYPVWVTWSELSRKVYGYSSEQNNLNLRRTAEKTYRADFVKYSNGKHAGARLTQTYEESWLNRWVLTIMDRGNYPADSSSYTPPTKKEVLRAFHLGLAQRRVSYGVNVGTLTKLVNDHCGTDFDPSETAWTVLNYQLTWQDRRAELLQRIAGSIDSLRGYRESTAAESRKITVGPFRLDPQALSHCPCCQQSIPQNFPNQFARLPTSHT